MGKLILILFLFSINFQIQAQNRKGFYGAKFYTTFDYDFYLNTNNTQGDLTLNNGLSLSFAYIAKRNFAFNIETALYFKKSFFDSESAYISEKNAPYNIYFFKMNEKFNIRTYSIIPKIEFCSKNALLPMGLSHQIGFGITQSEIVMKDYDVEIRKKTDSQIQLSDEYLKNHLYDFKNSPKIIGFTALYSMNYSQAITKHLFIKYSLRYTYNFPKPIVQINDNPEFALQHSEFSQNINYSRRYHLLSFRIGVVYLLKKIKH